MDARSSLHGDESQALVFTLGEGQFGIDILQVMEIRGAERPAEIPAAPDFFKGVINLRGDFVPVIDLRIRLGVRSAQAGVTIVVHIGGERTGIVVDSVSDVVTVPFASVRPPPAAYASSTRHVRGLLSHEGATIMLLDIESVLAGSEATINELMAAASDAGQVPGRVRDARQ